MKKELKTSIEIQASAQQIWKVLTQFNEYPSWNPLIKKLSGKQSLSAQLEVHIAPANRKPMVFRPIVLEYEQDKTLRWLGKGPIKGLFDGEHYFIIEELEAKKCRFVHGEKFSGILVGLMPKLLRDTETGFNNMNQSLREKCEGGD